MKKLNSNGTVAWQKIYGGSDNDFVYSIQETSDGGYYRGGLHLWIISKLWSDSLCWI